MIFITLGSQKFQFNRLLRQVDNLVKEGIITEEVFAQIGYSDYIPQRYKFKNFLDKNEFDNLISKSDIIITHGGTGVIIGAVKKDKRVIAIPRLSKYKEHVDDHQVQLTQQFDEMGIIKGCFNIQDLRKIYRDIYNYNFRPYKSSTFNIIESIQDFLNGIN